MATYEIYNEVYGRTLEIEGDTPPTEEDAHQIFSAAFGSDLVFDNLYEDEAYLGDLKASYKQREGKEFEGGTNQLVEEEFEYWNQIDNNLTSGLYESASVFADMSKEEKQRTMRRFDMYDRTSSFGEGSRPFWEQVKGVGGALLTDPSNLIPGVGLWKLGAKMATKGLGKKVLEKIMFPAATGATWGALSATERQTREMALEARDEFSGEEIGDAATMGAVIGPVAPFMARTAGRAVKGTAKGAWGVAKLVTPKGRKEALEKAQTKYVNLLGSGSVAAERAVVEELGEAIGKGDFAEGTSKAFGLLSKKESEIKNKFIQRFDELGDLNVRTDQLNKFVRDLQDVGIEIPAMTDVLTMLKSGEYTRSQALREMRSIMSDTVHDAYLGRGDMPKRWRLLNPWNDKISKMFVEAGERAGKGKQATKLDKDWSEWQKFRRTAIGGGKDMLTAGKELTKLDNLVSQIVVTPSKSLARWQKVVGQVNKMGEWSGYEDYSPKMLKYIKESLKSELFTGRKPKALKFLENKTGRNTLKMLFPEQGAMIDDLSVIYMNAVKAGNNSVPMFWGRIIPVILGSGVGGATGGQAGAAVGTAVSLKGIEAALSSPLFRKMAMNAYKDGNINTKQVNGMVQWLNAKGFNGNGLRDQLLGTAAITTGVLWDEATNAGQGAKELQQEIQQNVSTY